METPLISIRTERDGDTYLTIMMAHAAVPKIMMNTVVNYGVRIYVGTYIVQFNEK